MQNKETDREGADVCINEKGNIESHKRQDYTLRRTESHHGESCEINDTGVFRTEPSAHCTEENSFQNDKDFPARRKMRIQSISTKAQTGASQNRTISLSQTPSKIRNVKYEQ